MLVRRIKRAASRVFSCLLVATGPLFILLAVLLISFCGIICFSQVLPWHYPRLLHQFGWWFHSLCLLYVLVLTFFNYIKCILTHPGKVLDSWSEDRIKESGLDTILIEDFTERLNSGQLPIRMCKKCAKPKPDRAHHCSICKSCVLKMDHHCPWIHNCVGHYNHRYFYLFLVYLFIACMYYFALALPCILHMFQAEPQDRIRLLSFSLLFSFLLATAIGLAIGLMAGWHTYLIMTAQTTIDYYNNQYHKDLFRMRGENFVNEFDLGTVRNLKLFFNIGKKYRWWTLLLPISVPPVGDGCRWVTCGEFLLLGEESQLSEYHLV